jgi:hypothetical protein
LSHLQALHRQSYTIGFAHLWIDMIYSRPFAVICTDYMLLKYVRCMREFIGILLCLTEIKLNI